MPKTKEAQAAFRVDSPVTEVFPHVETALVEAGFKRVTADAARQKVNGEWKPLFGTLWGELSVALHPLGTTTSVMVTSRAAIDNIHAATRDPNQRLFELFREKMSAKVRIVRSDAERERDKVQTAALHADEHFWDGTNFVGAKPSAAALGVVREMAPDESPWLFLTSVGAGALAAFGNYLVIVKTGVVVSFMAGSLGRGRTTMFAYPDITAIEYNGQLMSGVLEILTPSYQGTANKDFWRGTTQSRNANSDDPYTLSNTLPLSPSEYKQALPRLNELRGRIVRSKSPGGNDLGRGNISVADEIRKLKELLDQGIVDQSEFDEGKKKLLSNL
ncbi:SHOCT domain-containing protein [Mycetocola sp. 2940]|uniref:SHOCT domain-containing protein n=1 Tax=Mycetocola sp. 2940 TaxID=3156452 RepID=UPI0033931BEC